MGRYSTQALKLCAGILLVFCAHAASACLLSEYEITRLLLAPNVAGVNRCQKEMAASRLIDALRIANTYWARGTTNEERYALLSKKYKDTLRKIYHVKNPEQYVIPLTEAEREWQGYKVNHVNIISPESIELSLQVMWSQEGYRGTMTYLLALITEEGRWVIANVHI